VNHPDILVHRVRLSLSIHSEGGLTAGDFDLAAASTGSRRRLDG
jgi:pterin-4a-carbinolamine dehydratase